MARRRYQKPKPRMEGRQWVLYYWDDEFQDGERRRKKKRHVLGPATMGEREAEKVRDEFLRPLNQGLVNVGSATKLNDYVESVYRPVVLPTLAKTTRDRYVSVYKNHLGPAFGEMCLRDITQLTVAALSFRLCGIEAIAGIHGQGQGCTFKHPGICGQLWPAGKESGRRSTFASGKNRQAK